MAVDFGQAAVVAWFWAGDWVFPTAQLLEGSSYQAPAGFSGWSRSACGGRVATAAGPRRLLAAASALVFTGGLDFTVLSRSQAPFAGPLALDRLCVALCLGLGLGVTLGALAMMRGATPESNTAGAGTPMSWSRPRRGRAEPEVGAAG